MPPLQEKDIKNILIPFNSVNPRPNQEINFINPSFYNPIKFPVQLSLSIDSVINPQPTGIYIVVAHLIPPGGLFGLDNLDNSYVVCCFNVYESETWF
jgi:hypothetical protein